MPVLKIAHEESFRRAVAGDEMMYKGRYIS